MRPEENMNYFTSAFVSAIFLAVVGNCGQVESFNILVLESLPSPSHHLWITKVTTALAAKGYNITTVTSNIDKKPTPNIHYVHLERVHQHMAGDSDHLDFVAIGKPNPWIQIKIHFEYTLGFCEGAILSDGWRQLQNYPKDFKFDLVIHDYPTGHCLLAFLRQFNYPPMIGLTAFCDGSSMPGDMSSSAFVPSTSTHYVFKRFKYEHFLDRMDNYVLYLADYLARQYYLQPKIDAMIRNVAKMPQTTSVYELAKLHKIIMINHDLAIDMAEQFPANVIGVGGLQIEPAKDLNSDYEAIMTHSKAGVVLFSLGTNMPMHLLDDDILTAIFRTFERFPEYTFLCKYILDTPPARGVPANVVLRKWIPQNDLLASNRTKLFITHGGLLSTQEAVWHAVPMLGIPLFVDQFLNIEKSIRKGIAEKILLDDLTASNFYNVLKKMLTDEKYARNMYGLSAVFHDQKETPLERAVWWVEWSLRHPNATHMQGVGTNLNRFQLQSLDVIGVLFVGALMVFYGILCVLKKCVRLVCGGRRKEKRKTD